MLAVIGRGRWWLLGAPTIGLIFGVLGAKFGIRHTPAVVVQTGKLLHVSETVLKPGAKS